MASLPAQARRPINAVSDATQAGLPLHNYLVLRKLDESRTKRRFDALRCCLDIAILCPPLWKSFGRVHLRSSFFQTRSPLSLNRLYLESSSRDVALSTKSPAGTS